MFVNKSFLKFTHQFCLIAFPNSKQLGVVALRGLEIDVVLDENKTVIKPMDKEQVPQGNERTLCIWLDAAQYMLDLAKSSQQKTKQPSVYKTFNLLIRRKPKVRFSFSSFHIFVAPTFLIGLW